MPSPEGKAGTSLRRWSTPWAAATGMLLWAGVLAASAAPADAAGGGAPVLSHAQSVAALPGVVLYLSDPDLYQSGSRETLTLTSLSGHGRTLISTDTSTLGLACLSPDGTRVAYFRAGGSAAAIDVMDLATKRVNAAFRLGKNAGFITGLAWSADGRTLIVGATEPPGSASSHRKSALWEVPAAGGRAIRVTPYEDAGSPAVMPDGDLIYVVSKTYSSDTYEESTLWRAGPDGTGPRRVASSPHFIAGTSVSPDGRTVAFSVTVNSVTSHLAEVSVSGGTVVDLTRPVSGRSDLQPAWSPDGSELLFLSSRAGRYATNKENQLLDAYLMSADGRVITKAISYSDSKGSLVLVAWGKAPAGGT